MFFYFKFSSLRSLGLTALTRSPLSTQYPDTTLFSAHVTLHPHDIQASRTSAVQVQCSRETELHAPMSSSYNGLLPRLVYIILRLHSSGYGSTIRPKELSPPPHRTSFSARHLTHSLPNGDGVCPDDDIKTPTNRTLPLPNPPPRSPSS